MMQKSQEFHQRIASLEAEFSSTSQSKFNELRLWLARLIELDEKEVRVKYISKNKQLRNRLSERGSSRVILAILGSGQTERPIEQRIQKLLEQHTIQSDSVLLATKRNDIWAIRKVFEFQDACISEVVEPHFPQIETFALEGPLVRFAKFPEPYREIGLQIISMFGQVLTERFPNSPTRLNIHQAGDRITLAVFPKKGERETVKNLFLEFGEVLTGNRSIEQFGTSQHEIERLQLESEILEQRLRLAERQSALLEKANQALESENSILKQAVEFTRHQDRLNGLPSIHFHSPLNINIHTGDRYEVSGSAGAVGSTARTSESVFQTKLDL